jgi:xanthine dehydrogenase accessory factor
MVVFAHGQVGTIGGGQIEWRMLAHARSALTKTAPLVRSHNYALGPSLGQCCGGRMHLVCEFLTAQDRDTLVQQLAEPRRPVALFGAGHVGQALVQALAPLPLALTWIDSRDNPFPDHLPAHVRCEHSDPIARAVADLPEGAAVLIMSFSHAEDLDVVAQCLLRQRERGDLAWIGLIGSRTKWATFQHRLQARGFSEAECAGVCCPIGLPGIRGKQPAVIAASVAAQLLQVLGL